MWGLINEKPADPGSAGSFFVGVESIKGSAVEFARLGPDEWHLGVSGVAELLKREATAGRYGNLFARGVEELTLPRLDLDERRGASEVFGNGGKLDAFDVSVDEEDVGTAEVADGGVGLGGVVDFEGKLSGLEVVGGFAGGIDGDSVADIDPLGGVLDVGDPSGSVCGGLGGVGWRSPGGEVVLARNEFIL